MNLVWLVVGMVAGWAIAQKYSFKAPFSTQTPSSVQSAETAAIQQNHSLPDADLFRQTELAYYRLAEIAQYKSGFLARSSHELRSPLSGLIGMQQLVLENLCDSPEEERDCIAQANESAQKMVHILDEIIDAAKLEHGTAQPNIQPVQLAPLLQKVYRLCHLQAQNRNIPLHIPIPDAELYVLADPKRLQQALVRLIDVTISEMTGLDLTEGAIQLSVQPDSSESMVCLAIEQPLNLDTWSDPIAWMQQNPNWQPVIYGDGLPEKRVIQELAQIPFPSPGFSLLLAQILLQSMQGTVHISSVTETSHDASAIAAQTRIECYLPQLALEPS